MLRAITCFGQRGQQALHSNSQKQAGNRAPIAPGARLRQSFFDWRNAFFEFTVRSRWKLTKHVINICHALLSGRPSTRNQMRTLNHFHGIKCFWCSRREGCYSLKCSKHYVSEIMWNANLMHQVGISHYFTLKMQCQTSLKLRFCLKSENNDAGNG